MEIDNGLPTVMGGLIETETGRVMELTSPSGLTWLNSINSFRYKPTSQNKAYTVRKEGKDKEYWYGYRKVNGKLHKRYMGKILEIDEVRLEATAEALNTPAEPRTPGQPKKVTPNSTEKRVEALEQQIGDLVEGLKILLERKQTEKLPNPLGNLEPGAILSELRTKNKKTRTSLTDVELILEMIQKKVNQEEGQD